MPKIIVSILAAVIFVVCMVMLMTADYAEGVEHGRTMVCVKNHIQVAFMGKLPKPVRICDEYAPLPETE